MTSSRLACVPFLALALAAPACGDGATSDPNAVFQDSASDEAWEAMVDSTNQGVTESDLSAAHLTAPTEGAVLSAATPATFTWSLPASLRHGVATGTFVWLHFALSPPLEIVSITSTSWTPDAELWARFVSAGSVDVTITTATLIDGVVREGPFRPTMATTSFTVQQ
jgi:hypothetical protein